MAEILYVPETLRIKLGEDGTKELINLINQAARSIKENISETAAERIERRIAETKTEIIKEISAAESRLFWKVLAFLAGQTGLLIFVIKLMLGSK
jgi:glycine cleavage system protein P-like pyridoxal-binding family